MTRSSHQAEMSLAAVKYAVRVFLLRMFDVKKSKNRSPDRTFWKNSIGV
jgi:hypothetical protein